MLELGVQAGDWKNIDTLCDELKEKGYDVEYENVSSSVTGFIARMVVNDYEGNRAIIWVVGDEFGHFIQNIDWE